jgi:SAM-dependent methyltransferase
MDSFLYPDKHYFSPLVNKRYKKMSSYSRQQLEAWLKKIDARDKVLDVGGSQRPIKGRTKSWNVSTYHIWDLETPHEKAGQRPDFVGDINVGIPKDERFEFGVYDQVFCIEVSEYWWDPLFALRLIGNCLKPGGKLFISFHFFYPIHSPENADFLRYTRSGARKLLKEAGFEIDSIVPKHFDNPMFVKMLYDNEQMKGLGKNSDEIHKEQGWLVTATRV